MTGCECRWRIHCCSHRQSEHVASEFNHGTLHAEADAEERDFKFTRKLNRLNFAFDTTHSESARNQQAIDAFEQQFRLLTFQFFGFNAFDIDLSGMCKAGMIERFVDGFVRIAMFDVLSDNGDGDFVARDCECDAQARGSRPSSTGRR